MSVSEIKLRRVAHKVLFDPFLQSDMRGTRTTCILSWLWEVVWQSFSEDPFITLYCGLTEFATSTISVSSCSIHSRQAYGTAFDVNMAYKSKEKKVSGILVTGSTYQTPLSIFSSPVLSP